MGVQPALDAYVHEASTAHGQCPKQVKKQYEKIASQMKLDACASCSEASNAITTAATPSR